MVLLFASIAISFTMWKHCKCLYYVKTLLMVLLCENIGNGFITWKHYNQLFYIKALQTVAQSAGAVEYTECTSAEW